MRYDHPAPRAAPGVTSTTHLHSIADMSSNDNAAGVALPQSHALRAALCICRSGRQCWPPATPEVPLARSFIPKLGRNPHLQKLSFATPCRTLLIHANAAKYTHPLLHQPGVLAHPPPGDRRRQPAIEFLDAQSKPTQGWGPDKK